MSEDANEKRVSQYNEADKTPFIPFYLKRVKTQQLVEDSRKRAWYGKTNDVRRTYSGLPQKLKIQFLRRQGWEQKDDPSPASREVG